MRIAAGIVTYNPDIDRLKMNLSAICCQVEQVFVYDNASSDVRPIEKLLEEFHCVDSIFAKENGGMAVALNSLALVAAKAGYTHILYLDQDSVSTKGMVGTLASHIDGDERIAIANAWQEDINGKSGEPRSQEPFYTKRAITSGSLVDLAALADVGGYDERLFVDWVDFDFCDSLILGGYKILTCTDATLLHDLGEGKEYVMSLRMRSQDGTIKKMPVYRYDYPEFRVRDQARSRAIVIEKFKGTSIGSYERSSFFKNVLMSVLVGKRRMFFLATTAKGFCEGIRVARTTKSLGRSGV